MDKAKKPIADLTALKLQDLLAYALDNRGDITAIWMELRRRDEAVAKLVEAAQRAVVELDYGPHQASTGKPIEVQEECDRCSKASMILRAALAAFQEPADDIA
jgi:hypothetical protein